MNPTRAVRTIGRRKGYREFDSSFFSSEFLCFVAARRRTSPSRDATPVATRVDGAPVRGRRLASDRPDVLGRPRLASGDVVDLPALMDALDDGRRDAPGAGPGDGAVRGPHTALLARLAELHRRVLK